MSSPYSNYGGGDYGSAGPASAVSVSGGADHRRTPSDFLTVPSPLYAGVAGGGDSSEYSYESSAGGDSPTGEEMGGFGGQFEGGAELRRSASAGSGSGRKIKHASQACDNCRAKKTKCDGGSPKAPCSFCAKAGLTCTSTAKDNRKTPSKAHVATLERRNQMLESQLKDSQRQARNFLSRMQQLKDKIVEMGGSVDGMDVDEPEEGGTAEGPRNLTITIPGGGGGGKGKQRESKELAAPAVSSSGAPASEGQELLNVGQKLVRDRSGSLTAYAAPSPFAHLPSSDPPPKPAPPPLGWHSQTIPFQAQLIAADNFFLMSGTELLPIHGEVLTLLHQALGSGIQPLQTITPALELTPTLYNALMADALPFLPRPAEMFGIASVGEASTGFAQAAGQLEGIFSKQGLGNVLGLGLLAQWCAGAGQQDVGWYYSGMSARMMLSLGLHLDFSRSEKDPSWAAIPAAERRLRNIVYWIVYSQDLIWSMWVGRATAVQDSDDVPFPDVEGETNQPQMVFRALAELTRVARRAMTAVYGVDRTTDAAVIETHRLGFDRWFDELPILLRPTQKAMESAQLYLRHLHLIYYWLRLLFDRQFYRQITVPLNQEVGVQRCDHSLRQIMLLLAPWDVQRSGSLPVLVSNQTGQQPNPVPLTPLVGQIVFSTGITWLQSAVAFHKFSNKRKEEGLLQGRICLRILTDGGNRAFASILRRLMRNYFKSVEIGDHQMQQLGLGMQGLGVVGQGGISVPMLPTQIQMQQGYAGAPQDQGFSPELGPPMFAEPGAFDPSALDVLPPLARYPSDLLSPPVHSPNSAGTSSGSRGHSRAPSGQGIPTINWIGPDTEAVHHMTNVLRDWPVYDPTEEQLEPPPQEVGVAQWLLDQQQQPGFSDAPEEFDMEGMSIETMNPADPEFRQRWGERTVMQDWGRMDR